MPCASWSSMHPHFSGEGIVPPGASRPGPFMLHWSYSLPVYQQQLLTRLPGLKVSRGACKALKLVPREGAVSPVIYCCHQPKLTLRDRCHCVIFLYPSCPGFKGLMKFAFSPVHNEYRLPERQVSFVMFLNVLCTLCIFM